MVFGGVGGNTEVNLSIDQITIATTQGTTWPAKNSWRSSSAFVAGHTTNDEPQVLIGVH